MKTYMKVLMVILVILLWINIFADNQFLKTLLPLLITLLLLYYFKQDGKKGNKN